MSGVAVVSKLKSMVWKLVGEIDRETAEGCVSIDAKAPLSIARNTAQQQAEQAQQQAAVQQRANKKVNVLNVLRPSYARWVWKIVNRNQYLSKKGMQGIRRDNQQNLG